MRSISTMRGDGGETSLAGGVRVSKGSLRVETYGTVDELNSSLGFARSICEDAEIAAFTKGVQQDLFRIGSSLATPAESPKPQIVIDPALTERLTDEVHRLEAIEGMLADWSIPGNTGRPLPSTSRARSAGERSARSCGFRNQVPQFSRRFCRTSTDCPTCSGSSAESSNTTPASADRCGT